MTIAVLDSDVGSFGTPGPTGRRTIGSIDTGGVVPDWVLVFGLGNAAVSDFPYSCEYDGFVIPPAGNCVVDTTGEAMSVRAFFACRGGWAATVGASASLFGNPSGAPSVGGFVIVGYGNNPRAMGMVYEQEDQAITEENVDGGPIHAMRFACVHTGLASGTATDGANTDRMHVLGSTNEQLLGVEAVSGTGIRPVGFDGALDDCAAIYLAVAELPPPQATDGAKFPRPPIGPPTR